MDFQAQPDASSYEDKAPSGSPVLTTISRVSASARRSDQLPHSGEGERDWEEPAMVSDGDVLCFLTPAPVLQHQHSLTPSITPGGHMRSLNPEPIHSEPLQSLHRAMAWVPSSSTERDIQPQLREQFPFQGPSQQVPTPALLGTSPGRPPTVLLPLHSASPQLLPGGQDRVTSWAGPR